MQHWPIVGALAARCESGGRGGQTDTLPDSAPLCDPFRWVTSPRLHGGRTPGVSGRATCSSSPARRAAIPRPISPCGATSGPRRGVFAGVPLQDGWLLARNASRGACWREPECPRRRAGSVRAAGRGWPRSPRRSRRPASPTREARSDPAYQRSDLLKRRAEVVQDWSDYVTPRQEAAAPVLAHDLEVRKPAHTVLNDCDLEREAVPSRTPLVRASTEFALDAVDGIRLAAHRGSLHASPRRTEGARPPAYPD